MYSRPVQFKPCCLRVNCNSDSLVPWSPLIPLVKLCKGPLGILSSNIQDLNFSLVWWTQILIIYIFLPLTFKLACLDFLSYWNIKPFSNDNILKNTVIYIPVIRVLFGWASKNPHKWGGVGSPRLEGRVPYPRGKGNCWRREKGTNEDSVWQMAI